MSRMAFAAGALVLGLVVAWPASAQPEEKYWESFHLN